MSEDLSLAKWKILFDFAREILKTNPWETYYDTDIFGVQDPGSGEIVYCSVLGNEEEIYGLNFYVGKSGLEGLLKILQMDNDFENVLEVQDIIWMHFEKGHLVHPDEKKTAKILGMDFEKEIGWPTFVRVKPGYFPYKIELEDAELLIRIFPRVLEILDVYREKPEKLRPEDYSCMVSFFKDGKWNEELFNLKTGLVEKSIEGDSSMVILENKGKFDKVHATWEVGINKDMEPIKDEHNKTFFPVMGIVVDEESGFVIVSNIMKPDENNFFVKTVKEAIEHAGFYPSIIKVKDPEAESQLREFCEKMNIEIILVKQLPGVTQFVRSIKKARIAYSRKSFIEELKSGIKRYFPSIKRTEDSCYLEYSSKAREIMSKRKLFFDYLEAEEWEKAEELGNMIIRKLACQFDIYSALSDYYVGEERMGEAIEIQIVAIKEFDVILQNIPEELKFEWGFLENRSFLCFMAEIGFKMFENCDYVRSRNIFERLLKLNPEDNQGIRTILPKVYFELGEYEKVLELAESYDKDILPALGFAKVIAYLNLGRYEEAEKALYKVSERHPKVVTELLKKKHQKPSNHIEGFISIGGDDEAYNYYLYYGKYWKGNAKAMKLLKKVQGLK